MPLPTLIDAITARAIAANEERLCDIATGLIEQDECDAEFTQELRDHLAAVELSNELIWAHESGTPADEFPHHAATELKLYHLAQLDSLTNI